MTTINPNLKLRFDRETPMAYTASACQVSL